ncbi:WD40-repeat-containing domain protein [Lactarius hatsudake]|nr:WD40-repeat-containing domain protein [Lactarius hatsudake]
MEDGKEAVWHISTYTRKIRRRLNVGVNEMDVQFSKVQTEMFCEDDHMTIQDDVDSIMTLAAALAMSVGSSAEEGNDIMALSKSSQLSLYVTSITSNTYFGCIVTTTQRLSRSAILFLCGDSGTGSPSYRMMTVVHMATFVVSGLCLYYVYNLYKAASLPDSIVLDGHRLVTGSTDCTVLMWSVQSGRALCRIKSHSPVLSVVWLRNSNGFLFGCKNGMMASVDIGERFVKTTFFKGHSVPIHCLSPKFNDLFPISGAMDEVKIWKREVRAVEQVESWELKVKLPPPSVLDLRRVVEVTSVNWQSQDVGTSASLAIVSYRLHGILCWDVAGMTVLWQFPIDDWCNGSATLSLSPDGRLAATVDKTNNFEIRDLKSGAVQSLQVRTKPAVKPYGIRDLKTGATTTQGEGQIGLPRLPSQRVSFAHEGFAVTGVGSDNKVFVWDAERGDQLLCLEHGAFLEEDDQFLIVTATENSGKSYIFLWATVPRVVTTSTSSPIGGNHIELNFPQNFWIHLSFVIVVVAVLLRW